MTLLTDYGNDASCRIQSTGKAKLEFRLYYMLLLIKLSLTVEPMTTAVNIEIRLESDRNHKYRV